jgi:hypothetical protein
MELQIVRVLDEQAIVGFTGKINVLSKFNRQYLGHVLMKEGELYQVIYSGSRGLKAFYQIVIEDFSLQGFEFIVEPEVVREEERQVFMKYESLKTKMAEVLKLYRESMKLRPPETVKIVVDAKFMGRPEDVTAEEFEVLSVLTEWNKPVEIYRHCQLLDHEITMALVSLRKKNALKIVASR